MGVCCCLQICNSVVNMVVMGLVLRKRVMVISITNNPKYLPFIIYYRSGLLFTCKLHCLKHVTAHWVTEPDLFTSFQTYTSYILGFKLKNKNKKNWRNGLFAIFPMFVVQILGTHTY